MRCARYRVTVGSLDKEGIDPQELVERALSIRMRGRLSARSSGQRWVPKRDPFFRSHGDQTDLHRVRPADGVLAMGAELCPVAAVRERYLEAVSEFEEVGPLINGVSLLADGTHVLHPGFQGD